MACYSRRRPWCHHGPCRCFNGSQWRQRHFGISDVGLRLPHLVAKANLLAASALTLTYCVTMLQSFGMVTRQAAETESMFSTAVSTLFEVLTPSIPRFVLLDNSK